MVTQVVKFLAADGVTYDRNVDAEKADRYVAIENFVTSTALLRDPELVARFLFVHSKETFEFLRASSGENDRLSRIAQIIDHVDNRAMAGEGNVLPTLEVMDQSEISAIYALALGHDEKWRPAQPEGGE